MRRQPVLLILSGNVAYMPRSAAKANLFGDRVVYTGGGSTGGSATAHAADWPSLKRPMSSLRHRVLEGVSMEASLSAPWLLAETARRCAPQLSRLCASVLHGAHKLHRVDGRYLPALALLREVLRPGKVGRSVRQCLGPAPGICLTQVVAGGRTPS